MQKFMRLSAILVVLMLVAFKNDVSRKWHWDSIALQMREIIN